MEDISCGFVLSALSRVVMIWDGVVMVHTCLY